MKPGYSTIMGHRVRKELYKHKCPKTFIHKDNYKLTITHLLGDLEKPLSLLMYFRLYTRKAKIRGIK